MGVIWTTFCGGKEQVREGHFKTTMIVFILMSHCASNRGRSVISLKTSFSLSFSRGGAFYFFVFFLGGGGFFSGETRRPSRAFSNFDFKFDTFPELRISTDLNISSSVRTYCSFLGTSFALVSSRLSCS